MTFPKNCEKCGSLMQVRTHNKKVCFNCKSNRKKDYFKRWKESKYLEIVTKNIQRQKGITEERAKKEAQAQIKLSKQRNGWGV